MRRPLTNSELTTWRRCHRKWWLGWHRGLRRLVWQDPSSMATGTSVHAGLQEHYQEGTPLVEVARRMRQAGLDLEPTMLEGYEEWLAYDGADQSLEVVDVEVSRAATLPGTDIELRAKADLRFRRRETPGRVALWGVEDHKTVQSIGQFDATSTLQPQPLHYLLVERLSGLPAVEWAGEFLYNLLRRVKRTRTAKPPFYARLPVYHTDRELWSYLSRVKNQVARMDATAAALDAHPEAGPWLAEPNPTRDCTWDCPFFAVCGMFDDRPQDAEAALAVAYEEGDPLEHHQLNADDQHT